MQIRDALTQPQPPEVKVEATDGLDDGCPCCPLCGAGILQWVAELIPTAAWARRRRR